MLDTAFEALARRDAAAALTAARAAVADQPERADAHQALGLALQLSGDHAAAAQALEQAIALAPQRSELHLARASLAIGQHDHDAAETAIGAAIGADPNSLGAYLMATHMAIARSELDEADQQLRFARKVGPDHPQVTAAEGALALARHQHADALQLLSKAVADLPDDPLVLAALGLTYRATGNHAFAEAALQKAIARQPQAVALRWALVDSLRRQNREAEAIEPLRELLNCKPDDRQAMALLGDLLMARGDVEAGLETYRQLILLPPFQLAPLDRLLQRMVQAGMRTRAVQMLEEVLRRFPDQGILWQRRMQAAQTDLDQLQEVLGRWQKAQPESAQMHAARADFEEWRGNYDDARALAETTLRLAPDTLSAEAVLLRGEIQHDPDAALQRVERLQASSAADEWQRALGFWRGQALDRLDRAEAAVAAWQDAWLHTRGGDPLPAPSVDASDVMPGEPVGSAPRLLWSPPGGRPREVLAMLARLPGFSVLDDRFSATARNDGFGPPRADGALADRGGWRHLIEQLGGDPERCIDWLPHWDARIAAALPGATLVTVIGDPRDMLLNWLAFASPLPVRFPGAIEAADWLRQVLEPIATRVEAGDTDLLLVRDVELVDTPEALAQRLQECLRLDALPHFGMAADVRRGMGGLPVVFPPGHWRRYAQPLAAAFERLQPLAQRFGYAAD